MSLDKHRTYRRVMKVSSDTYSSHQEVPIEHPERPKLAELGLKWHGLPAISNMYYDIGGVIYTAAPFNGW